MECDKCKHGTQTLQTMIQSVPNILVLHMKEFRYTNEGHLIKLEVRLNYQEYLDVAKYTLGCKGTVYELFAFIRHIGSSQSGHYTCMTKRRHPVEKKKVWVNFDDEVTDIVKNEQHNIDNAYLLFFKRVDMPTSAYLNFTDLEEEEI